MSNRNSEYMEPVKNVDDDSAWGMMMERIARLRKVGTTTDQYGRDNSGLYDAFLSGWEARSEAKRIEQIRKGYKDPGGLSMGTLLRSRAIHLVDQNPKR